MTKMALVKGKKEYGGYLWKKPFNFSDETNRIAKKIQIHYTGKCRDKNIQAKILRVDTYRCMIVLIFNTVYNVHSLKQLQYTDTGLNFPSDITSPSS